MVGVGHAVGRPGWVIPLASKAREIAQQTLGDIAPASDCSCVQAALCHGKPFDEALVQYASTGHDMVVEPITYTTERSFSFQPYKFRPIFCHRAVMSFARLLSAASLQ